MNLKRYSALMIIMSVMFMPAVNSQQAIESLQQPELIIHSPLQNQSEQTIRYIVVPANQTINLPSANNKSHVHHWPMKHRKLHAVGVGIKSFIKVLLPVAQLAGAAATIVFTIHQFR